ncbi:MAG: leucine-rich repeat domain-containing protein [Clostridiales bacterium]|nr:leucine-rich repeat domain-containing protein [Clostridiales bacterium]
MIKESKFKSLFTTFILAAVIMLLLSVNGTVKADASEVASGTCGDSLTWTLSSAGTLTISGTGKMTSWSGPKYVPWYDYHGSIKKVVVENNVKSIGKYAFGTYYYNLTSVTLPSTITSIGDSAFRDCSKLTSINLPSNITTIGSFAFEYCTGLKDISLPSSLISVGTCTFAHCSKLKSISIPVRTTVIAIKAFESCTSLKYIFIPTSTTEIQDGAFLSCTSLSDVYYAGTSAKWEEISIGTSNDYLLSCTFHYNATGLPTTVTSSTVSAGSGTSKATYTILSSTTAAYTECSTTKTTVTVPAAITINGQSYKVTSVASGAFKNNKKITSVTVGSNVTSIGSKAFYGCTKLTKTVIGKNVTTIGKKAFAGCTALKKVTFKTTKLKKIGAQAFKGDKKLTKITLKSTKLTKKGIKNALKGSYIKTVKTTSKLKKKYKKYFTKANCGVKATIK